MTSLTNPLPEHVRATIDEVCAANGVTSIDVQIRGQRDQLILDLFIDAPNGVTHEECRGVTTGLDERLENDEWYGRLRAVDVSSPGADAPVKFLWQLTKSIGRTVRVIRADGTAVEGKLTDVADEGLSVQPPTTKKKVVELVVIPAADVKEARVILKW